MIDKFVGEGSEKKKDQEEETETSRERAAEFARLLFESFDKNLPETRAPGTTPTSLSLDHLALKGGREHENKNLCPIQIEDIVNSHFVEVDNNETTTTKIKSKPYSKKDIDRVSREQLVTLLGRRVRRRVNSEKKQN